MLESANRVLVSLPRAQLVALAALGLVLIGAADLATGFEIAASVFYVGPVSLVAWYVGRRAGVLFALLAAATWLAADLLAGHVYSHAAIPVWNAFARLGFFLIIVALLDALRMRLEIEARLARTDSLTGALNRRAFVEQLDYNLALARRERRPLALAYVDLDDFKRVNDAHGHGEGDRVLRLAAQALASSIRRTDAVARLGGDEFALILPDTDSAGAERLVAKAMRGLADALPRGPSRVTCSVGTAVFREPPASADEAIRAADAVMYRAKSAGKATVLVEVVGEAAARRAEEPPRTQAGGGIAGAG
jgi:diguanylate cyclase (GGDEF)-like protein